MKQYYIFLLNAVFIAIFDLIDSSFGNNLGIDSICAISAFTIISWCANTLSDFGRYAYEIKLKHFTECFLLQLLSSGTISICLLLFCNKLPYIYHLTDVQYKLTAKCLYWYAVFLVIHKLSSFLWTYIELDCQNKLLIVSNITFYIIMIALDILVVVKRGKCYHLVITTGLSYTVYFILLLLFGKFKKNKPSRQGFRECFDAAKDRMIDRCLGKVATIVFNILVSYLGTELYALHSVGYAIATNSETITDEWYSYQLVRLHEVCDKEKYTTYKTIRKQTFLPTVILCYLLMLLLILPMHGETNLIQALFITCLYQTQSILLCIYENARGYLSNVGCTKVLRYGGLIGILARLPIAFLSILTPIGIYGFAFASGIDFLIRGIYYAQKAKQFAPTENRKE